MSVFIGAGLFDRTACNGRKPPEFSPDRPAPMEIEMDWKDQYKHPNWQKRRLEVLQAHDFTCQLCWDKDETLNVHHKAYIKGRKVWEYDDDQLECLCETCHEETHTNKENISALLSALPTHATPAIIALVAGYCSKIPGIAHLELSDSQTEATAKFHPIAFSAGCVAASFQLEHFKAGRRQKEADEDLF